MRHVQECLLSIACNFRAVSARFAAALQVRSVVGDRMPVIEEHRGTAFSMRTRDALRRASDRLNAGPGRNRGESPPGDA
jgi:hypothetical protein